MKTRSLLGVCVLAGVLGTGCKSGGNSGLEDAGLIGPDGQVVLFYRDGGNVVIKQCEDFSVLKTRDDCTLKSGTTAAQVEVEAFRKHLLTIVRISDPNTFVNADTKRKMDVYQKADQGNAEALEAGRQSMAQQLEKIKAFNAQYGEASGNPKLKADLDGFFQDAWINLIQKQMNVKNVL